MALKRLDKDLRSKLRSAVSVSSFSQCIQELVENSIDAGANTIVVHVNLLNFKIKVIDNGCGIAFDDLKDIGERYTTNKIHSAADLSSSKFFGFHGEALASIISLSGVVEVLSKHKLCAMTHKKIFIKGQPVKVEHSAQNRSSLGTTVSVQDFMYNIPVRRQRILEVLEMNKIRQLIECMALIHPFCSFSVFDDSRGACIFSAPMCKSVVSNFCRFYGSEKASHLKLVCATHNQFKVQGYISVECHHNTSLQFVYINGRIVESALFHTSISKTLYRSLFDSCKPSQSSSCGSNKHGVYVVNVHCSKNEYDITPGSSGSVVEFFDWSGVMTALKLMLEKFLNDYCCASEVVDTLTVERIPLHKGSFISCRMVNPHSISCGNARYCSRIRTSVSTVRGQKTHCCSDDDLRHTDTPSVGCLNHQCYSGTDVTSLNNPACAVLSSSLGAAAFTSSPVEYIPSMSNLPECESERQEENPVPVKSLCVNESSVWKRRFESSNKQVLYVHSQSGRCSYTVPAVASKHVDIVNDQQHMYNDSKFLGWSGDDKSSQLRASNCSVAGLNRENSQEVSSKRPRLVVCSSNPHHKHKRLWRERGASSSAGGDTVLSLASICSSVYSSNSQNDARLAQTHFTDTKIFGDVLSQHVSTSAAAQISTRWNNPTFKVGETEVVKIGCSGGGVNKFPHLDAFSFTKDMLLNAEVIGQVDCKFIACIVDLKDTGFHDLLVMVDQHAAHERVRLEMLTEEIYQHSHLAGGAVSMGATIKSSPIRPAIPVNVTSSERKQACLFIKHFRKIGVFLDCKDDRLMVTAVPSLFLKEEELGGMSTVSVTVLQALISQQLELLQSTGGGFSALPPAISHVLNSKACHGAIKFGDQLTLLDCKSIISKLSKCKLPFQCAHGRPSVAPIVNLQALSMRYPTQCPSPNLKKLATMLKNQ